jgi:hypothetical protein
MPPSPRPCAVRWLQYAHLEELAKSRFFRQKHIYDNVSAKEEAAFTMTKCNQVL